MGRSTLALLAVMGLWGARTSLAGQTESSCALAPADRAALLASGYEAFDQTPGEGWRGLVDDDLSCAHPVAELIDEYARANASVLTGFNLQILNWHAGQLYGFADANELARARFVDSFNPAEAAGDPPWNAYVRATLAFFDRDLDELQRQRAVIEASPTQMNLNVVDRLIAGFGRSYAEAYRGR